MTEEKPPSVQHGDPDDVVERAVERAATKVAAAATPTNGSSPELLSKIGSITAVAIIVIVGLVNFVVNLQTRNSIQNHARDFKAICQIIVQQSPPEAAKDLAVKLAECLK